MNDHLPIDQSLRQALTIATLHLIRSWYGCFTHGDFSKDRLPLFTPYLPLTNEALHHSEAKQRQKICFAIAAICKRPDFTHSLCVARLHSIVGSLGVFSYLFRIWFFFWRHIWVTVNGDCIFTVDPWWNARCFDSVHPLYLLTCKGRAIRLEMRGIFSARLFCGTLIWLQWNAVQKLEGGVFGFKQASDICSCHQWNAWENTFHMFGTQSTHFLCL